MLFASFWLNAHSVLIMLPFSAVAYEDAPVIVSYQSILPADLDPHTYLSRWMLER